MLFGIKIGAIKYDENEENQTFYFMDDHFIMSQFYLPILLSLDDDPVFEIIVKFVTNHGIFKFSDI